MNVVFVCWGNICRSPLAEHLFRRIAGERGLERLATESFGLTTIDGDRPIGDTVRAGLVKGVDVGAHRAEALRRAAAAS